MHLWDVSGGVYTHYVDGKAYTGMPCCSPYYVITEEKNFAQAIDNFVKKMQKTFPDYTSDNITNVRYLGEV